MLGVPLIFSASIGHGHDQAARAIKEELERNGFSNISVIDTLHWLHPSLHFCVQMSYRLVLRYRPSIWKNIFFGCSRTNIVLSSYEKAVRLFAKRVGQFIEERKPPFIISTHPFSTLLVALAKEEKNLTIPLYSVITDFQLHPAYVHKQVTSYFTIDHAAKQFALFNGLNPMKFHQTGIPTTTNYPKKFESYCFKQKQCIPSNQSVILVTGGGLGIASYNHILEELERLPVSATILFMTGHNEHANRKMKQMKSKHDLRVFSFTEQFISFLAISDVLITKAGGLTLSEALACEIPVVLYEILPGHEEQNAKKAVEWGMALHAFERKQILEKVETILTNKRVRKEMILSARHYKKPNATIEIVNEIITRHLSLSADDVREVLEPKGLG